MGGQFGLVLKLILLHLLTEYRTNLTPGTKELREDTMSTLLKSYVCSQ